MLHAPGSADNMLTTVVVDATGPVTLVTVDRALRGRAEEHGARLAGPGWLIDVLGE